MAYLTRNNPSTENPTNGRINMSSPTNLNNSHPRNNNNNNNNSNNNNNNNNSNHSLNQIKGNNFTLPPIRQNSAQQQQNQNSHTNHISQPTQQQQQQLKHHLIHQQHLSQQQHLSHQQHLNHSFQSNSNSINRSSISQRSHQQQYNQSFPQPYHHTHHSHSPIPAYSSPQNHQNNNVNNNNNNNQQQQQHNLNSHPESNANPTHQLLKRTASRAELDRGPTHSEPPPPLPTTHHHSNSQSTHEDQVFVKPEYLTPHLPNQPLPPQPNHLTALPRSTSSGSTGSPRSCDSELRHSNLSRPRSIILPTSSSSSSSSSYQPKNSNSIKKRRVTITDDRLPLKPRNTHLPLPNPSSSSPDTRIHLNPVEPSTEPISPLVIGFNQPHNPSAMQQVAHTIKLREEQKRLIEQRRNSFAGHSSLNSFSFSSPSNHTQPVNPPPSTQTGRCSPHTVASRTSISKPASLGVSTNTHHYPNNDISKLLTHQNPINSSSSNNQQPSYPPPPPVVNLPSIDEAATSATKQNPSNPNHQHRVATQTGLNHSNHPKSTPTPDNTLEPESPPRGQPTSATDSTIASRRGHVVREKVKNLALAPQAFRPQLLAQSSVKSAPIRSGFLQATAPNGEVLKTPLIARTNLAASIGSNTSGVQNHESQHGFPHKSNSSHPNSNLNQASRLNYSVGPGPPNTAHPHLGGGNSYGKGLERRMTMHSGTLIQVPTLSHILINSNNSQSRPAPHRGRPSKSANSNGARPLQQSSMMPGSAIPPFSTNPPRHQPPLENLAPSQNHQPQSFQNHRPTQYSPSDNLHPPHSARPRQSIGSAGLAPPQTPGIPPKHMFLQLFDTFYDSLSDSKILQSNLEDQIRRSAQLLTLLQQSSNVFEKMLDERMANIQKEYTRDLQILENRIERLEARANHQDNDLESSNELLPNNHFLPDDDDFDADEDEDVKNVNLLVGVISPKIDSSKQPESNGNERMRPKSNQTLEDASGAPSISGVRVGVEERTTRISHRLNQLEGGEKENIEKKKNGYHHHEDGAGDAVNHDGNVGGGGIGISQDRFGFNRPSVSNVSDNLHPVHVNGSTT